eukprot:TRINITY_DN11041_c0_g1_i1.p1 TRINITY_DN11041_c0_g1~~TRINITY_DN11041_c0_g1_i1.p1  ORF type:complete len:105 (-),score=33.98 TRINITY_DN11041_c0_g1_i1:23-337(-)
MTSKKLHHNQILELMITADKFLMPDLSDLCGFLLFHLINKTTAVEIFYQISENEWNPLLGKCCFEILENYSEINQQENVNDVIKNIYLVLAKKNSSDPPMNKKR